MVNREEIPHSRGGATTREAGDLGVPMKPAADPEKENVGPEDALDPTTPKRGDYSGRIGDTRHVQTELTTPERYGEEPRVVTREQNLVPDPGGPLDAADPNYERLLTQRTEAARREQSR